MSTQPQDLIIFFADVAGSTRLYEKLGDVIAHECIVEALSNVTAFVEKNDGVVVEIIGDEVMAYFDHPKKAFTSSCDIQSFFQHFRTSHGHDLSMRIGFHLGSVELDAGHPFGDTVNVASRVSSKAQAGQILTTSETVEWLPPEMASMCRIYNRVRVKGKSEPLDMREIVWNQADATSIYAPARRLDNDAPRAEVILSYLGRKMTVRESTTPFLIGRGEHCNLVVNSDTASRSHARIEARFGELVVIDHSTNGTYITTVDGKRQHDGIDLHLHHREWTLVGSGKISLGKPAKSDDSSIIEFDSRS